MKIEINKTGEITITKKATLNEVLQKRLIKKMVTQNNYYKGEEGHDRWTVLYNAFDMVNDTDIRSEHDKYNSKRCVEVSRIDYLSRTGRINNLLYVASKLYKKEFEEYIGDFIK